MGREAVSLSITVKKKNLADFIREWNDFISENVNLDEDNLLEESGFEEDVIDPESVCYDNDEMANLFDMPNKTNILDFCKDMAEKYKGIEFDIEYALTWDNCGETQIESYTVFGGKINYDIMSGEYFCYEDDYEDMESEIEEMQEDDPDVSVELIDDVYYIVNSHKKGVIEIW